MNCFKIVFSVCAVFGTGRKERGWIISTMETHGTHASHPWSTLMGMTALSSSLLLVRSPINHVDAGFEWVSSLLVSVLTLTMPLFCRWRSIADLEELCWPEKSRDGHSMAGAVRHAAHHTRFAFIFTHTERIPLFSFHLSFFSPSTSHLASVWKKLNFQSSCMMRDCIDAHVYSGMKEEC